jgi:hypothetical protein
LNGNPSNVGTKRTFSQLDEGLDQSVALQRIIQREQIWSKSKNVINKRPDLEERTSKYDLTNFDIEVPNDIKTKF